MTEEEEKKLVPEVFSVSQYIGALNVLLKRQHARIMGEVSQLQIASSGHAYFSIKDKSGEGVLSCVMWKGTYAMCGIKLEVGMEIIISGSPNLYAPTGRFSMVVEAAELVGEGALKKAYDALKKKLEAEGLFAEGRKRKLPDLIHKIGVITSKEGAVIHDFRNNLGKFSFVVSVVDSRVEGQLALKDLHASIRTMRKQDIEVLVIIRGGGSLESLQAFNNESLVREVVDFPVPVIAGIGHDQDVPLVALAADYMTSTPTAVAHLLNRSWEEAYAKIRQVSHIFTRIESEFKHIRTGIDGAWSSMIDTTSQRIDQIKERMAYAEQVIKLNDPLRQLKLGYSIVRKGERVVRSVAGLKVGDEVDLELADGTVKTKVEHI